MSCSSKQKESKSELQKKVKLSPSQIQSFYTFYKKCIKKGGENMSYEDFKVSLGILGSDSGNFISRRLYDVICETKGKALTFDKYILFLNMVDYGTKHQKMTHCFKLLDENCKGYITANDFVNFVYHLCQYVSTITISHINLTKDDLLNLFNANVKKEGLKPNLNLEDFIQLTEHSPQFLDFFDIFNNKIKDNCELKINKEQFDRLNIIAEMLENFKQKFRNVLSQKSSITLVNDEYLDEINEIKTQNDRLAKQKALVTKTNGNKQIDNKHSSKTKSKLAEPLKLGGDSDGENNDLFGSDSDEHNSFDDTESFDKQSLRSELRIKRNSILPSARKSQVEDASNISHTTNDDINFRLIKPFTNIKDPKLISYLSQEGINIEQCLIVTNKDNLLSYISELHQSLAVLINEIHPNKIRKVKRGNIWINSTGQTELKVEDIMNLPFFENEIEKGMIHFGNSNLELVINLMIGIKNCVSSCNVLNEIATEPILYPSTNPEIYTEYNRFQFQQNNFGSTIDCKFYDFAPKIFYNLRRLYKITNEDYLKSLGPENFVGNLIMLKNKSLKELCSSGKSGSFFYFSYDSKYLLKTISEGEFRLFEVMLKDYYEHMLNNEDTLLQRFFGMHICIYNKVKMYFVVMNNVFITPYKVHYKYDLKGSTFQRLSRKKEDVHYKQYDFNIALKDNDFEDRNESVDLAEKDKARLVQELSKDSALLSKHNINDYSFLIGVHDPEFDNDNDKNESDLLQKKLKGPMPFDPRTVVEKEKMKSFRKPFYEAFHGGLRAESVKSEKIYFFGIIDTFTRYGGKKKAEHFFKTITQGKGISCQPPPEYSRRFINFMRTVVFTNDPNDPNNHNNKTPLRSKTPENTRLSDKTKTLDKPKTMEKIKTSEKNKTLEKNNSFENEKASEKNNSFEIDKDLERNKMITENDHDNKYGEKNKNSEKSTKKKSSEKGKSSDRSKTIERTKGSDRSKPPEKNKGNTQKKKKTNNK